MEECSLHRQFNSLFITFIDEKVVIGCQKSKPVLVINMVYDKSKMTEVMMCLAPCSTILVKRLRHRAKTNEEKDWLDLVNILLNL